VPGAKAAALLMAFIGTYCTIKKFPNLKKCQNPEYLAVFSDFQ
jgi:hypothetical protein